MFLKAHSFPRASLQVRVVRVQVRSRLGTNNVHGQISEDFFFLRQIEAIVNILLL